MRAFSSLLFTSALRCSLALLLVCAMPAQAARPFVTDDARITAEGSCQLESWVRSYSGSQEFWALPACNLGGNLELTLGGGQARNTGEPLTSDTVLQFKTIVQPLRTNGWGWGLAAGTVHHPEVRPGPNQLGNQYVYAPLSASFDNDRWLAHLNVGWLRDKASSQDRMTWGLGTEFASSPTFSWVAETFGDDKARPYWQAGWRVFVVPQRFQLDFTFGQQAGGDAASRWLSLGLRYTPGPWF
jgi:hypothetical protein